VAEVNIYVKPMGLAAIKFMYTDWMDPASSRSNARQVISDTFRHTAKGSKFTLNTIFFKALASVKYKIPRLSMKCNIVLDMKYVFTFDFITILKLGQVSDILN
jgi:hypothetical protein